MEFVSAAGVNVTIYASDGEVPFIMNEIVTQSDNLVDDIGNQFVDDSGNEFAVDRQISNDGIQQIFKGKGMGVVQLFDLTIDTGDTIIIDTGATIGVYDSNQDVVDGGKLNLVYQ